MTAFVISGVWEFSLSTTSTLSRKTKAGVTRALCTQHSESEFVGRRLCLSAWRLHLAKWPQRTCGSEGMAGGECVAWNPVPLDGAMKYLLCVNARGTWSGGRVAEQSWRKHGPPQHVTST
jgi:hypothetical protein